MLGGLGALNKVGQAVAKSLPPSSASLYLDFTLGTLDSRITFTRGSNATLFNSAGTLVFAPNNLIRNNTMVGAVAGTPGTLPTNWTALATAGGLTREIVGIGTVDGIPYIDIRYSGTTTDANSVNLAFDTNLAIAASSGQTWTSSSYVTVVGGNFTNITSAVVRMTERTGAGSFVGSTDVSFASASGALRLNRFSATRTLGATAGAVQGNVFLTIASGVAIDITLRIGMPQLERGSVATEVSATSGTAYYGPRFDYDHSTLAARGLLIEEARTNSIRNNTMQGAVAGTPGTLPTNWTGNATVDGLSREVVGTGTENGINYIDVRFSGTSGAAGNSTLLTFESQTQVVAANGQTWTNSAYLKLAAGTLTNVSLFSLGIRYNNSGGSILTAQNVTLTPTATLTRYTNTLAATDATTAFVNGSLVANFTDSSAVDFTVRIGLPQLEQGAFATSVIPTTTTALTRNADVASMTGTNFSSWYNASEGTLFANWTSFIPNGTSPGSTYAAGFTDNLASTGSAQLVIQNRAVNNQIRVWQSTTGGGLDDFIALTTTTFQGKAAAVYGGAANVTASANGGAAVTMANPIQTTIFNALTIGSASGATTTSGILNGHIQRIAYYPSRLPNTTLQALTA